MGQGQTEPECTYIDIDEIVYWTQDEKTGGSLVVIRPFHEIYVGNKPGEIEEILSGNICNKH
jgi:hypothetical protein